MTREEDWGAAVAAAVGRFGRLDILVNNAGIYLGKGIEEASLEEWRRLADINLTGVFLGTKLALPALRDSAQAIEAPRLAINTSLRLSARMIRWRMRPPSRPFSTR